MEREPQPDGGERKPEINSYGTDDPEEQARIEQARADAAEQRRRDRARLERYVEAGLRPDDAETLIEFEHYVRDQRGRAAKQLAEQHTEDSAGEREIRIGLYLARAEGRVIGDATARRIAAELGGDEGSALDGLASSGVIHRDQLLQDLASYPAERSWRIHWIDALTQYVLDRGDRGPMPGWDELTFDEAAPWDATEQVGEIHEVEAGPHGVERAEQLRPRPRIYVACLASYNQGIQHGLWIDAAQDVEELEADIQAMLASSPAAGAEEYAIHDFEGFHGFEIGEHEDLAVVSRVAKGIAECGEAFAAYLSWAGSSEEALREFRVRYVGTFADREAWARAAAEQLGWKRQLEERLDPALQPYVRIDYDAMVANMDRSWQVVETAAGVHVFIR